jgi:hypothetical protein
MNGESLINPTEDDIPILKAITDKSEKNKKDVVQRVIHGLKQPQSFEPGEDLSQAAPAPAETPWTLQQFFDGEIDLDAELASRFSNIPLMSTINLRNLGSREDREVATIASQDGAAQVVFETDRATQVVQMAFTFGSMLTLRFTLVDLSVKDRARWMDLMRREEGGLTFLWGPSRWEKDYLVCISRKYYTNLYAFSPHNFNAAIRMTPEVTDKLLDWLGRFWQDAVGDDEAPDLLTW